MTCSSVQLMALLPGFRLLRPSPGDTAFQDERDAALLNVASTAGTRVARVGLACAFADLVDAARLWHASDLASGAVAPAQCALWPTADRDPSSALGWLAGPLLSSGLPRSTALASSNALLLAIALVETGRAMPGSGRLEPWPWSLNVEGEGRTLPSRAAAIAEARALLAEGRRSIDIGCMQINLLHHPGAFASLEEGFEPAANIRYAIGFLRRLQARQGSWEGAIAAYHSGDPVRGGAYHRKVALARLGSAWAGGGVVPLHPQPALAGLCAPGFRPALQFTPPLRRPRLTCTRV